VLFIVMVMFAPGGLVGLACALPSAAPARLRRADVALCARAAAASLRAARRSSCCCVELASFTTIGAAPGRSSPIAGTPSTRPRRCLAAALSRSAGGAAPWMRREGTGLPARALDALMDDAKRRGAVS
jgi:hypothetical protein